MPTFSAKGNDEYICQKCARVLDSVDYPPQWLPIDRRADKSCGNVCPACVRMTDAAIQEPTSDYGLSEGQPLLSLQEHCAAESGHPIGSRQLDAYINRYYGFG